MHVIQAHHLKKTKEFKGWSALEGKQLKYVYIINPMCKILKPVLGFSEIDVRSAGMYKGKKITLTERRGA